MAKGHIFGAKRTLIFLILILIIATLGFLAFQEGVFEGKSDPASEVPFFSLWNNSDYSGLLLAAEECLYSNPYDAEALYYGSAAAFYYGIRQISPADMIPYFDRTIRYARTLIALGQPPHEGMLEYLLGKAYFYKGFYYYDLAASYLESSLKKGYFNPDIYEYLAECHGLLGNPEISTQFYLLSLEKEANSAVYIKVALNCFQIRQYDQAEDYYMKALDAASDDFEKETAFRHVIDFYIKLKNYTAARAYLDQAEKTLSESGALQKQFQGKL